MFSYKKLASQSPRISSMLLLVLLIGLGLLGLAAIGSQAIATINIWKHRYPFHGGYGIWPYYGGYGGGYGGISIGGGGGYGRR